jgi:hypothetical protein
MYSTSLAMREARSCDGVRPAAWTPFSSGSEILPSGRTGTVRLTVVLSQTAKSSTSSIPIRYSELLVPRAGAAGAAGAGAFAGAAAAVGDRFVASCAPASPAIISDKTSETTMGLYRIMTIRPVSRSGERRAIS